MHEATIPSSAITGPVSVPSLTEGYMLNADLVDGSVTVNSIPVTGADINATNGIIHSISESPLLPPCVTKNLVELLAAKSEFSTLVDLVTTAGLVDNLSGPASEFGLTVMAPTNAAFEKVPAEILAYLGSNVTALTEVLTYHVIPRNFVSVGSTSGTYPTLNGESLEITVSDDAGVKVGAAMVEDADNLASNGVYHQIDTVLVPTSLVLPAPTMAPTANEDTTSSSSSPPRRIMGIVALAVTAVALL